MVEDKHSQDEQSNSSILNNATKHPHFLLPGRLRLSPLQKPCLKRDRKGFVWTGNREPLSHPHKNNLTTQKARVHNYQNFVWHNIFSFVVPIIIIPILMPTFRKIVTIQLLTDGGEGSFSFFWDSQFWNQSGPTTPSPPPGWWFWFFSHFILKLTKTQKKSGHFPSIFGDPPSVLADPPPPRVKMPVLLDRRVWSNLDGHWPSRLHYCFLFAWLVTKLLLVLNAVSCSSSL